MYKSWNNFTFHFFGNQESLSQRDTSIFFLVFIHHFQFLMILFTLLVHWPKYILYTLGVVKGGLTVAFPHPYSCVPPIIPDGSTQSSPEFQSTPRCWPRSYTREIIKSLVKFSGGSACSALMSMQAFLSYHSTYGKELFCFPNLELVLLFYYKCQI